MTRLMIKSCGLLVLGLAALAPMTSFAATQTRSAVQRPSDDTLKDRVAYRIETYPATKKYDINVKVVNADVLLTGTVATAAQKAEAGRLAKIQGVNKVDNEIKVDPAADKTLLDRAKGGMNRAGEAITDGWITTKVKWFYLGDDMLKGSKINVDTNNRVVTLTGTVMTEAGKKHAVLLAQETDGVTKVVDHLTIGK